MSDCTVEGESRLKTHSTYRVHALSLLSPPSFSFHMINPYSLLPPLSLQVGITTLASGFTGVISIGLFLLGVTVAIGVAKGELDPNNEKVEEKKDV